MMPSEIERLDELHRSPQGLWFGSVAFRLWPEIKAVLPVDDDDLNAAIRRELGEEPEGGS